VLSRQQNSCAQELGFGTNKKNFLFFKKRFFLFFGALFDKKNQKILFWKICKNTKMANPIEKFSLHLYQTGSG
jgi:hypothetical protein